MPLFYTMPDNKIIDFWISSINEELHSAVSQKVFKYKFDFFISEPGLFGQYDWAYEKIIPKAFFDPPSILYSNNSLPHCGPN